MSLRALHNTQEGFLGIKYCSLQLLHKHAPSSLQTMQVAGDISSSIDSIISLQ
ncbi:MAG: hypothetical protein NT111_03250 [Patescibacteria group bacterium]|nr:hypothetical protein [Patescibacteria group bacterium]